MGKRFLDQYSLLHFASGVIAYFFDISWGMWFLLHTIFEFVENTNTGIDIINNYITIWPGGKPEPDSFVNSIGDTILAMVGWLCAFYLDQIGIQRNWYIRKS